MPKTSAGRPHDQGHAFDEYLLKCRTPFSNDSKFTAPACMLGVVAAAALFDGSARLFA